jgi:NitT/TauT family transport system permease protein
MIPRKLSAALIQVAIAVGVAAAWELAGRHSAQFAFLLGTPSAIVLEFIRMLLHEELLWHFLVTGTETLVGLILGTLVGLGLGLSLWFSDRAAQISKPFVIVIGSLPVIAFAPLMIVWFGIGIEMKIALAALSTLFIAFNQAYRGVRIVGEGYVDVLRGMNAPRAKIFIKVVIPGSIDWLFSSMRLNIGFGLLGAFIGEFIASNQGLGYLILRASSLYNMPRALAAAAGIAILAVLMDIAGGWIERHRHAIVQLVSVPKLLWRRS